MNKQTQQKAPLNIVGLYAKLQITAERYQQSGQPVPRNVVRNIQAIESLAQSRLPPNQLAAAQHFVQQEKHRLLTEEAHREVAAREQREAKMFEHIYSESTRGLLDGKGLTPEQLDKLRRGKLKLDSKPADTDAQFRAATKNLDPAGKGWSRTEYERRMNALTDAPNDAKFAELAKGFRADPAMLRQAATRWEKDRVQYELQRRLDERDPKVVGHEPDDEKREISERTVRHAAVVDSVLTSIMKDTRDGHKAMGRMMDFIEPESLEDEGRRGDVARAMAEVEQRDERGDHRYISDRAEYNDSPAATTEGDDNADE